MDQAGESSLPTFGRKEGHGHNALDEGLSIPVMALFVRQFAADEQ
jgi:hypothetical protein